MPRIDPVQLLNCLQVLLSPNGGIRSKDEVQRLAKLMTKFSKKLVSKCIYIQILKNTESELLDLFMGAGGWMLLHIWLTESIVAKNWLLVRELLELLLQCPVDIERLKTNNCPKLVKELSKDGNHLEIRAFAAKLVEQWLKTVKGETVLPLESKDFDQVISDAESEQKNKERSINENNIEKENNEPEIKCDTFDIKESNILNKTELDVDKSDVESEKAILPVLKISVKDGKQVISQVDNKSVSQEEVKSPHKDETKKDQSKEKYKSKDKARDKTNSSSSSSSKSSSKDSSSKSQSSSDKDRSKDRRSSSNSSHSKDRDKHRDKTSSDSHRSKHSDSSSKHRSSSSSSRSKDERKSSSDKDKSKSDKTIEIKDKSPSEKDEIKPQTLSIQKLGKIPKFSDAKKDKPSISIEVRKPEDPKPKTVKTFNSKFRKHGLEEEIKPPPSRAALLNKKTPSVLPPSISIPKRPSPVRNDPPPEKKAKIIEPIEKPGSIKLIPPKPKPVTLLESDMFMDALNASATNKKEPKKRKRRTSGSRDGNTSSDRSPPHTPPTTSPNSESKSVPPKFYQDILETEDEKNETIESIPEESEKPKVEKEKVEILEVQEQPHTLTVNGLKGVLCYHKRKGPKRSITWKADSELEEIQYFELDETERVNVTKTSFTDMKHLERINERDAFQKGRNISTDDVMEEKTSWKPLMLVDTEGMVPVDYGKNSKEKDIQAVKQKATLQPLYFHKSMIPDSPLEPDSEAHPFTEPIVIPLEDITGNPDNISDFRNVMWPEAKGNAPPPSAINTNMPAMFPPNMPQFANGFPPAQFVPGFQGPNIMPVEWPNGIPPPNMLPNGMPMVPGPIPPASMPPSLLGPPDNMMMVPEIFGPPNGMFPMADGFNMPQNNMFQPDFNMGPQGPPGPDGFPGQDGFPGPGGFRGPMRGRGVGGGHWRGKGNWDGPPRGRGGNSRGGSRKNVCIYFQRKGSCRQGDNCSFLHPGVNGPY